MENDELRNYTISDQEQNGDRLSISTNRELFFAFIVFFFYDYPVRENNVENHLVENVTTVCVFSCEEEGGVGEGQRRGKKWLNGSFFMYRQCSHTFFQKKKICFNIYIIVFFSKPIILNLSPIFFIF